MAQGPTKRYRFLTQMYIETYPPGNVLVLGLESRAEGEDEPQKFEVALTKEQALSITEELTKGLDRIR